MKEVIIKIRGGVAEPSQIPKGVRVTLVDYDCEGAERERLGIFAGEIASIGQYEYFSGKGRIKEV